MENSALEAAIKKITPPLSSRQEVVAGYVFGSAATGRARPDSDIDIAVLVNTESIPADLLDYRLRLMADLRHVLERSDVEVVVLNQAPPALAYNVVFKGRLIYEQSRSARIRFQLRTFNSFWDTQPMRDLHLTFLKRRYLNR